MKKIQGLYLQLIEETCFNSFDGKQIAKDLRENLDAWDAVLMTKDDTLIILRDLPEDNRVDTLYLRLSPHSHYTDNPLYKLAESTWGADQTEIVSYGMEGRRAILSYWWD